jgi:molybdopterin-guanine dinucleotide biosynthesis protein MobB
VALLQELAQRGLKAAVLKHARHVSWPTDKDSGLFMQAEAIAALVVSPAGWQLSALPQDEPDFAAALDMLEQSCRADLALVEGYKQGPQPKLLLTKEGLSPQQLPPHTVALVSETPQHLALPCFSGTDIKGIADFIINYCKVAAFRV